MRPRWATLNSDWVVCSDLSSKVIVHGVSLSNEALNPSRPLLLEKPFIYSKVEFVFLSLKLQDFSVCGNWVSQKKLAVQQTDGITAEVPST